MPCYSHDTLKLHFESLGNHCKLSRFVLVMIGTIIFCPGPSMPRGGGGGGVLRCCLDGGARLTPPNQYPSLRVILAEKGTHY